MYHELEVPGRPLCQSEPGYLRYVVKAADFCAQIHWLRQTGWRGISVSEALALQRQNGVHEDKVVAITFDDGCESDLSAAAPALREIGYRATFYVTVGFLGKRGHMNESQVRELSASGFEIGCHSMTHPYLPDLSGRELQIEIVQAKEQLEGIVGKRIEHFSCPGGRCSPRVIEVARNSGYRSVATSSLYRNMPASDVFALGRFPIRRELGLASFRDICRGEGLWKMQLRDCFGNVAKHVLGNSIYDRSRALLLR